MHTQTLSAEWSQVAAFVAAVDAKLGAWLSREYGIGLTDYRALVHLAGTPEKELRVGDLALRLGLNQSSTTRLVARLEVKQLLRRDLCPDDARGIYAVITAAGEDLVATASDPYEERLRSLLASAATDDPRLDPGALRRALAALSNTVRG